MSAEEQKQCICVILKIIVFQVQALNQILVLVPNLDFSMICLNNGFDSSLSIAKKKKPPKRNPKSLSLVLQGDLCRSQCDLASSVYHTFYVVWNPATKSHLAQANNALRLLVFRKEYTTVPWLDFTWRILIPTLNKFLPPVSAAVVHISYRYGLDFNIPQKQLRALKEKF